VRGGLFQKHKKSAIRCSVCGCSMGKKKGASVLRKLKVCSGEGRAKHNGQKDLLKREGSEKGDD